MLITSKFYIYFINRIALKKNRKKIKRKLEIGPGVARLDGFEVANIFPTGIEDYILDACSLKIFKDGEFSLIYASHILEHIPWYQTNDVLTEWVRVLEPGGVLEVWVPDGLKICRALVDYEDHANSYIEKDGWYKFNPSKDPAIWASGRLYSYGDGNGSLCHRNWHRALFNSRLLKNIFHNVGLINIQELDRSFVRGYDHGWINLGICGEKPKAS
jgi:predicted SAM-dependent methyltransferase